MHTLLSGINGNAEAITNVFILLMDHIVIYIL